MESKVLGLGIIGCGMVADWHAQAAEQIPQMRLSGVYDINLNACKLFADKYEITAFDSLDSFFDSGDIDVVSICTPSALHAPLAIQAANASKHVIIEKPVAITLKDVNDVIYACEKNNVKASVISQLRFTKAVKAAKDAVSTGALGKLICGDVYMKYYRPPEYYSAGGWKGTWEMDGGGALMNQGIHGVDLLQYIMGSVKSVFGHIKTNIHEIEVEDTAAAVLEFNNGALGVIQGTTSISPGFSRRLEIHGEKGSIIIEEDSILHWSVDGTPIPKFADFGKTQNNTASDPAAFGTEGHKLQLSNMADAILSDKIPLVDLYEAKKPVEIILSIYKSSRQKELIYL